jgi:hypothetical protein
MKEIDNINRVLSPVCAFFSGTFFVIAARAEGLPGAMLATGSVFFAALSVLAWHLQVRNITSSQSNGEQK